MFFICQLAAPDFPWKVVECVCDVCGKTVNHRIPWLLQPLPEGWAKLCIQGKGEEREYLICSVPCIYILLDDLKKGAVS